MPAGPLSAALRRRRWSTTAATSAVSLATEPTASISSPSVMTNGRWARTKPSALRRGHTLRPASCTVALRSGCDAGGEYPREPALGRSSDPGKSSPGSEDGGTRTRRPGASAACDGAGQQSGRQGTGHHLREIDDVESVQRARQLASLLVLPVDVGEADLLEIARGLLGRHLHAARCSPSRSRSRASCSCRTPTKCSSIGRSSWESACRRTAGSAVQAAASASGRILFIAGLRAPGVDQASMVSARRRSVSAVSFV